jgi:hypothetical protein
VVQVGQSDPLTHVPHWFDGQGGRHASPRAAPGAATSDQDQMSCHAALAYRVMPSWPYV